MLSTLELLVGINQVFYCYGFLPQILTNYRLKTGAGLSYGLLFTVLNGQIALQYYFSCLELPISYRISIGLQLIFIVVWIGQKLYYASRVESRRMLPIFLLNAGAALALFPLALRMPYQFGHAAGWAGVGFLFINRIPQIIKIFREQSVRGFSFGSVVFSGVAAVMEIVITVAFGLPVQTLFTSGMALVTFFILTYQFYLYQWLKG